MSTNYFVDSYGDSAIILRMSIFRFIKVTIPRASIASVRNNNGVMKVETTGHNTYQVLAGFKNAQRRLTREAFARSGVAA